MKGVLGCVFLLLLYCGSCAAEEPSGKGLDYITGIHIRVENLERSTRFYSDVFGLKVSFVQPKGPIEKANEVLLSVSGAFDFKGTPFIALELVRPGGKPLPKDRTSYGHMVSIASDPDAIAARARAAGYVAKKHDKYVTMITDPDGYQIEVVQPPPQAQ